MEKLVRILLVEDDEVDYRAVRRMVTDDSEWRVELIWETDPEKCFEHFRQKKIDIILLDYRLGTSDGVEVLRSWRGAGIQTPVIVLTGWESNQVDRAAMDAGADDFLVKGKFEGPELLRALRYALTREESNRQLKVLKSALDHGPNGKAILALGSDGSEPTIIYTNPVFQAITGLSFEELNDQAVSLLFGSATDPGQVQRCQKALKELNSFSGEMMLSRPDGSTYCGSLELSPVNTGKGAVTHIVVVLRDISDRRKQEEQLRNQARMLDLSNEAIIAHDLEGRVIYWNQGAERLFGLDVAEVAGRPFAELLQFDAMEFEQTRKEVSAKESWRGEMNAVAKNGRKLILQSNWTLMRDERGEPLSFLTINTDITSQRELQEQFHRAQRMDAIGSLAAGVAHDLNNILAPIMMGASLIDLEKNASEELKELRKMIDQNTQRGSQIVRQLLSFARGSRQEKSLVQPRHLAKEICSLARETFPPSIKVAMHFPGDLWPVRANPTQIHQVLLNLAVNARDAMPDGGELTLSATNLTLTPESSANGSGAPAGRYTSLTVSDTGTGITPEVRDQMFDLFFTTKPEGQGTGLGLGTVKGIVEQYAGFIQLETEVGKGTRFSVCFPADTNGDHEGAPDSDTKLCRGGGETVLLVDDELNIRAVTEKALTMNGYRVIAAKNGADGVRSFIEHRKEIDIVVTDILMPKLDGPKMVTELRRMKPGVKVIFCSGACSRLDLNGIPNARSGHSGITCLDKPFSMSQLLKALRKALAVEVRN